MNFTREFHVKKSQESALSRLWLDCGDFCLKLYDVNHFRPILNVLVVPKEKS